MIKPKKIISISIIVLLILSIMNFSSLIKPYSVKAATTNGRIAGIDRYATAAEVTKAGWKTTSQDAIVVTGENFADALCSAPLAKMHNAPIILTESLKLNDNAKEELIRLNVKKVIIVGGTGAVSDNTDSQIKNLGISTSRIGGIDRYDTSVKIANELGTSSSVAVATGNNFPDALSIASIAAIKGMPILLTDQNKISDGTKNYLKSSYITKTYVVGGVGVISDTVFNGLKSAERIAGINRYETNAKVLNKFSSDLSLSNVYIATGNNFPDALSSSVLASNTKSPIVLIDDNTNNYTKTYIDSNINSISNVIAVGGTGVISDILLLNVAENFGNTYEYYNYSLDDMVNKQYGQYSVYYIDNRQATKDEIKQYVNPLNYIKDPIQKYQFMTLNETYGVTADQLNLMLEGKGILEGKGAAYAQAAKENGISEFYLLMHSFLETGNGTSNLATGKSGIKYCGTTVYNMFGIGAYDSDPDKLGAEFAYKHGWTTPEKAIIGGAAFIGTSYIKAGQNTLYKMKWNPDNPYTNQYASDVMWAYSQSRILYNILEKCSSNVRFKFDIPVFQ